VLAWLEEARGAQPGRNDSRALGQGRVLGHRDQRAQVGAGTRWLPVFTRKSSTDVVLSRCARGRAMLRRARISFSQFVDAQREHGLVGSSKSARNRPFEFQRLQRSWAKSWYAALLERPAWEASRAGLCARRSHQQWPAAVISCGRSQRERRGNLVRINRSRARRVAAERSVGTPSRARERSRTSRTAHPRCRARGLRRGSGSELSAGTEPRRRQRRSQRLAGLTRRGTRPGRWRAEPRIGDGPRSGMLAREARDPAKRERGHLAPLSTRTLRSGGPRGARRSEVPIPSATGTATSAAQRSALLRAPTGGRLTRMATG
jgi:hypothetical protein